YEYCSINSIKSYNIEGSLTSYPFRRSSLTNEEVDNYGTITQEFSSLPSLTIKGTVSKDEAKTTETSKLKLEFNYDDLVIKDIRTGTEAGDIEIFKLENISSSFNQGYTKIGTISEPAKQQTINMIQLGNNTYPIGGEELKTLDSEKQIIVSQSNDTNHKYVIISELYSDGNVEEKIYEFRSDRIYYLGSISYTSNIENWENITRNRMFFPTSGVLRQNNNLFSLGNEQEVSGLQFAHEVENKLQLNIFKYDELQVYHITQPYEHKCRLTYKTNSGWQLKTIGSGPSTTKEVEKDTETYVYDNYKIGDNITITMPNEIVYNISQNDLETIYTYKLNADDDAVDISKLSQEQIDSLVTSIGTKTNTIGFNGSTIEYDIYVLENQAKFVFNGKYVVVGQIAEGVVQTLNSEIELTETLNGESIASVTADIIGTNYDIFAGKQTNPDILAENGYVVTFTNDGTREYVIKYNNTVIATITGKAFDKIENGSIVFNGNVGKDLTIEGFDQNYINYNSSNSKLIVCLDGEISIYGAGNLEEVQYQINGYTITQTYDSNAIDTTYASKDGKTLAIAGCDEKLTEYTFKVISVGEYALLQGYTSFGEIGIEAQNVNKNILAVLQNFYSADLSGRVNSAVYSNPSTLKQMLVVNMGTNIFTFVEGTQNEISVIEDVSANKSILTSMSGYSNLYNFNYVKFSIGTNVENSEAYYFDSDGVNISDEIETSYSASFDEIVNSEEAETYYFVEYSDKVVFIFENAIIFESDTSYKYARLMPWANGGYIYEICKDNTMSYSEANQDGSVYYSRYGEKLDFKEFNETSFNVALDNTSGLVPKADGVHTVKVFTVYMGKK
ncbi:MAG: hypothetical protein IJA69_04540, partial [Clostridia bacterium]|nr:hypothetical protein [Clostridia bacterium]